MSDNLKTDAVSHRIDDPAPRLFSHGLRRVLTTAIDGGPTHETLGELSIITLSEDTSFKHQRRKVLRLMREIPVNRCRLVFDVTKFTDGNNRLSRLIYDIVNEAGRCRLNIYIGGVCRKKEALLELTRITQVVRCFSSRSEAISFCLQQFQTVAHPVN
jgi:hypothetical protein